MIKITLKKWPGTDYSFTDGTRVISITSITDIEELSQVVDVYNETQKVRYYAKSTNLSQVTLSDTNELTIDNSFDTLATGDILTIKIEENIPWVDYNQMVLNVIENAKAFLAPSSILNNISETNKAANKYFYEIFPSDYHAFHLLGLSITDSTSVNVKLYETMDEDAAIPATGGTPSAAWEDVGTKYLGSAALTSNPLNVKKPIERPNRLLLEVTFGSATNTIDIFEQQRN